MPGSNTLDELEMLIPLRQEYLKCLESDAALLERGVIRRDQTIDELLARLNQTPEELKDDVESHKTQIHSLKIEVAALRQAVAQQATVENIPLVRIMRLLSFVDAEGHNTVAAQIRLEILAIKEAVAESRELARAVVHRQHAVDLALARLAAAREFVPLHCTTVGAEHRRVQDAIRLGARAVDTLSERQADAMAALRIFMGKSAPPDPMETLPANVARIIEPMDDPALRPLPPPRPRAWSEGDVQSPALFTSSLPVASTNEVTVPNETFDVLVDERRRLKVLLDAAEKVIDGRTEKIECTLRELDAVSERLNHVQGLDANLTRELDQRTLAAAHDGVAALEDYRKTIQELQNAIKITFTQIELHCNPQCHPFMPQSLSDHKYEPSVCPANAGQQLSLPAMGQALAPTIDMPIAEA